MLCRLSLLLAAQSSALSPKELVRSVQTLDAAATSCSDDSTFSDELDLTCSDFGERVGNPP